MHVPIFKKEASIYKTALAKKLTEIHASGKSTAVPTFGQ
jgi:hypothetical protein